MSCLVPILFLALPWYIGNNEPFLTHLYSSCVNSCIVNFSPAIYFSKSLSFLEITGSHSSKSTIFLIDISGVNVTFVVDNCCSRLCESVEKRRFAHIRTSYNSYQSSHISLISNYLFEVSPCSQTSATYSRDYAS